MKRLIRWLAIAGVIGGGAAWWQRQQAADDIVGSMGSAGRNAAVAKMGA